MNHALPILWTTGFFFSILGLSLSYELDEDFITNSVVPILALVYLSSFSAACKLMFYYKKPV